MLTTFSHKPFQPPHFSVSSGMSPTIWDFNVIKSNWAQKTLKNTRKVTNVQSSPNHPPSHMGWDAKSIWWWCGVAVPIPTTTPHQVAAWSCVHDIHHKLILQVKWERVFGAEQPGALQKCQGSWCVFIASTEQNSALSCTQAQHPQRDSGKFATGN